MSITLSLSPEEQACLERAAAAEGRDVVAYIRERVLPPPPAADLAFLRGEARAAVAAAQRDLMARGIGFVYRADDGSVVRRYADGTEEPVVVVAAPSGA